MLSLSYIILHINHTYLLLSLLLEKVASNGPNHEHAQGRLHKGLKITVECNLDGIILEDGATKDSQQEPEQKSTHDKEVCRDNGRYYVGSLLFDRQ